jgi:hypothetical protein
LASGLLRLGPHTQKQDRQVALPRQDVATLRKALGAIPASGVVLSASPFVVLAEGRSSVFIGEAGSEERVCELARRASGNLYLWDGPSVPLRTRAGGPEAVALLSEMSRREVVAQIHSAAGTSEVHRLVLGERCNR